MRCYRTPAAPVGSWNTHARPLSCRGVWGGIVSGGRTGAANMGNMGEYRSLGDARCKMLDARCLNMVPSPAAMIAAWSFPGGSCQGSSLSRLRPLLSSPLFPCTSTLHLYLFPSSPRLFLAYISVISGLALFVVSDVPGARRRSFAFDTLTPERPSLATSVDRYPASHNLTLRAALPLTPPLGLCASILAHPVLF